MIKRWLPRRGLEINVESGTTVDGIPNIHKMLTSSEVRYVSLEPTDFDTGTSSQVWNR
jgi:hypothetical protein